MNPEFSINMESSDSTCKLKNHAKRHGKNKEKSVVVRQNVSKKIYFNLSPVYISKLCCKEEYVQTWSLRESFFNKFADLKAYNFIRKRLQRHFLLYVRIFVLHGDIQRNTDNRNKCGFLLKQRKKKKKQSHMRRFVFYGDMQDNTENRQLYIRIEKK